MGKLSNGGNMEQVSSLSNSSWISASDTRMYPTRSFSGPGPDCRDPCKNPDRLWSVLSIDSISARLVLLAPGALDKVLAPLKVHIKGSFLFHLDPHGSRLCFSTIYAVAGVSLARMKRARLGRAGPASSPVPILCLDRSSAQFQGYETLQS